VDLETAVAQGLACPDRCPAAVAPVVPTVPVGMAQAAQADLAPDTDPDMDTASMAARTVVDQVVAASAQRPRRL